MVVPEEPAQPAPLAAQVMASGMGRTEGDAAKGSPKVVVLEHESASVPLTPSGAEGVSQRGCHGGQGQRR